MVGSNVIIVVDFSLRGAIRVIPLASNLVTVNLSSVPLLSRETAYSPEILMNQIVGRFSLENSEISSISRPIG